MLNNFVLHKQVRKVARKGCAEKCHLLQQQEDQVENQFLNPPLADKNGSSINENSPKTVQTNFLSSIVGTVISLLKVNKRL